jgi:hypothetical protein
MLAGSERHNTERKLTMDKLNTTTGEHSGGSPVRLGDYVLATAYSDADPQDPWRIGFIVRIIETWCPRSKDNSRTYIVGEQDATWTDHREYCHARKITPGEGRAYIEANDQGYRSQPGTDATTQKDAK